MEQVGASRGHFQAVSLCFLLRSPACPQARPMLARSPGLPKPWGSLGDPGSLSPELRVPVYAWPVSPLAAPQGRDRIPACPSRHLHPAWSLQPPDQALAPVPFSGAGPAGWRWARGRRVPRLSREVWGGPGGSAAGRGRHRWVLRPRAGPAVPGSGPGLRCRCVAAGIGVSWAGTCHRGFTSTRCCFHLPASACSVSRRARRYFSDCVYMAASLLVPYYFIFFFP